MIPKRGCKTVASVVTAFVILFFSCLICFHSTSFVSATLKFELTESTHEGVPIAVGEFEGDNEDERVIAYHILKVIADDLIASGFFKLLDQSFFIERISFDTKPNFAIWQKIGVAAVVSGKVDIIEATGEIKVQFKIWDPLTRRLLEALSYKIKIESWRRVSHKIADEIYSKLLKIDGYFDSRIAFTAEQMLGNRRIKRIAVMDYDGKNVRPVTDGKYIVLSPKFHPGMQVLTYVSYRNKPQVFTFDLQTGVETLIWAQKGMSFSPRFSNDGSHIILSVAKDGTTAIYEVNIANKAVKKLTEEIGTISTSPSYSPDGQEVAFISDREGSQQIYIVKRNNSNNVRRVSQGDGAYIYAVFSPKDDIIAFTKVVGGRFYTGILLLDSYKEIILSNSWLEEGVTWAPNGRAIMFHRQLPSGMSNLYTVSLKSGNRKVQKVQVKFNGSDPSWSPVQKP